MQNRKKRLLLFAVLILTILPQVYGQVKWEGISIGLSHNKLGIPLISDPIGDVFNPGIMLASEWSLFSGKILNYHLRTVAEFSYHSAKSPYGNVISLGAEFLPRWEHQSGFYIDALAGMNYSHIFSNIASYVISDDGISQQQDTGRPHIVFKTGVDLGYDLSARSSIPIKLSLGSAMRLIYAPSPDFGMLNILPATDLIFGIHYISGGDK